MNLFLSIQWKPELEEILEVALTDSDQWVSMLAEMMKTLPATGSLNTEVGEIDENRRIFTELVNDLRKLGKFASKSIYTIMKLYIHGVFI